MGKYQSGSASFRSIPLSGRAIPEYLATNRRFKFAAPSNERSCVFFFGNVACVNDFVFSVATESFPGVITCPS